MVALTCDGLPRVMKIADRFWFAGGFNGSGVAMATRFGGSLAQTRLGTPDRDNLLVESPLHR